ncbi:hypothetical protein [Flavobacterium aestivum]|uniref:hypothetical protein n=1 Tax=Flavobacterium aestivum TaxID=3003257 RepID=UPI0022860010|nr:hypothetical protein [Flavobacterium aestivum]
MKTITFDTVHAEKLELAISLEFGCRVSEIVSLRDSLVKKVVVFILSKTKKYDARVLGANYQISYLYVPTVITEMEYLIKTVPGFEIKIENVYQLIAEK